MHLVHHDGSVDSCSIHPELSGNPKTSSTFSAPCPAVRLSFDVTVSLVTVAIAAQDQGGMRPRQEGRLDSLNRTTAAPPLCSLGLSQPGIGPRELIGQSADLGSADMQECI